jgi:general secretion pathway protein C
MRSASYRAIDVQSVVSRLPLIVAVVLAGLVIFQSARLVWATVAPIGPVGDWRPSSLSSRNLPLDRLASFDPFFRLQPADSQAVVTSLPVKLFGVRVDMASGRGSAIIATPDGVQNSYAVGDEVMPGVVLTQVAFDFVSLERGGTIEKVFLDQSVAAPLAGVSPAAPPAQAPVSVLQDMMIITPRMEGAKVTGLSLLPKGDGARFNAAGLQAGDVLVSVNGTPVSDVATLSKLPSGAGTVSLDVERGGRRVTVSAKIDP